MKRAVLGFALLVGALSLSGCSDPEGFIVFQSTSCSCVVGQIQVEVDGRAAGSLNCGSSLTVPVEPGSHTVFAEDLTGTWGPASVTVEDDQEFTYRLTC